MEKIIKTLDQLAVQIEKGLVMCATSKHIRRLYKENDITSAYYLFSATYLAATESAIMAFARITIPNDDSITFQYLFNLILQKAKSFPHAPKAKVVSTVRRHKDQCVTLEPLIEKVRTQRDKMGAHLDRIFVNNPEKVFTIEPIDMTKVEEGFRLLLQIIDTYKDYAQKVELQMTPIEEGLADDIDYILRLIEKDNNED